MEKPDPKTCPHRFVVTGERWYGGGKYVFWQCRQCEAYLRPQWTLVNAAQRTPEEAAVEEAERVPLFPDEEEK